ncbi:type VII secretion-associated serine protease mycosin [Streptomyces sp. AV19]|uniref:type VII secretion-associated serine protease mycosin n=1 Tax=Streptomyces sp. AV19 TaxID=2793068 RepID=UPI0018FE0E11|nr:type VII secretion-associated serine protease mycosin [Streptomyces sp. AV19]MBH1932816.1 type VII secretion-associated serine protease mycosin [Streptomyces sp. AV19]MDG4531481.1 type VII secretion-associated serine protease mycosin [Streptomyces sp. AV19]
MRRGTRLARNARSVALHCAAALFLLASTAMPAHADTVRERQWHLDGMHAEEMWRTSDGSGMTVAVLDTGVDAGLPDLRGQVLSGKDFSESAAPEGDPGHGTGMAVLIAGTGKGLGGTGAMGLAPGAKILPVRVNDPIGSDRSLARAIRFAADSNAKIINISLGYAWEGKDQAEALDYAIAKGKLVFASAGNDGQKGNQVEYPAAHKGVVGVGAIDRNAKVTDESQRGNQVVLAAPGDDMYTTSRQGTGIRRSHGTSDASALASASAALLWSAHPDWTANQVLRVLINTAGGPKSGEKRSDDLGYGVVRPRVALNNPGDPGPADINPLTKTDSSTSASKPSSQPLNPKHESSAPKEHAREGVVQRNDDGGASTTTWVLLGAGAVVVVAAAVGVPLVVARRRRDTTGIGS